MSKKSCLDYLQSHHDGPIRAKKRNPKNPDWDDGVYKGAHISLDHLFNYKNKLNKEDL